MLTPTHPILFHYQEGTLLRTPLLDARCVQTCAISLEDGSPFSPGTSSSQTLITAQLRLRGLGIFDWQPEVIGQALPTDLGL